MIVKCRSHRFVQIDKLVTNTYKLKTGTVIIKDSKFHKVYKCKVCGYERKP